MAVAYQSHAIASWEGNQASETLVINKPSGLAVGDLMIVHLSAVGDSGDPSTFNWGTPGGAWTQLHSEPDTATTPKLVLDVFYKVADAGDVAASDFTFTHQENDVGWTNGAIIRISGAVPANMVVDGALVRADATPDYVWSLNQIYANSLLLFLVTAVQNAASGSVASYAIANNNPSWTEAYDSYASSDAFGGAGYGDGLMSMAYATKASTGAPGNGSVTLTNFQGSAGVLIIIPPVQNADGNHPILVGSADVLAGSVSVGTTATHTLLQGSGEIFDTEAQIETETWTERTIDDPTWTERTL